MVHKIAENSGANNQVVKEPYINRESIGTSFNYVGLFLASPFHRSSETFIRAVVTAIRPGQEGNCDSRVCEVVKRFFIVAAVVVTAPFTVGMALLGSAFDVVGDGLKQKPFIYLAGNGRETEDSCYVGHSFLSGNACCMWGGLPTAFGGLTPARERIDRLAEIISKQNADFVLLQEVSFQPGLELYEKLKDKYPHFYTRIGPNAPRMDSGLFIASKKPIVSEPIFVSFGDASMKRGAFCFETTDFWVLTTHLSAGDGADNERERSRQMDIVTNTVKELKAKTAKPCFVMGDLNINRAAGGPLEEYYSSGINHAYFDSYALTHPMLTAESATATNYFNRYARGIEADPSAKTEIVDYALLHQDSYHTLNKSIQTVRVEMFDTAKPEEALSDHHFLRTVVL
jgi:endonuclease/exonuclease/phosphatase family metal-dependent hydrolase